jgi:hypothetical protein
MSTLKNFIPNNNFMKPYMNIKPPSFSLVTLTINRLIPAYRLCELTFKRHNNSIYDPTKLQWPLCEKRAVLSGNRRCLSFGMLPRVVLYKLTDVSEVLTASIHGDGGGCNRHWNAYQFLPDYTAKHPRRYAPSYSLPCKHEISLFKLMFAQKVN